MYILNSDLVKSQVCLMNVNMIMLHIYYACLIAQCQVVGEGLLLIVQMFVLEI